MHMCIAGTLQIREPLLLHICIKIAYTCIYKTYKILKYVRYYLFIRK